MAKTTTVKVNGERFDVDIRGLRLGDTVKGVGEQCVGCGNALDCRDEYGGAYALLRWFGSPAIECSECGVLYPIEER